MAAVGVGLSTTACTTPPTPPTPPSPPTPPTPPTPARRTPPPDPVRIFGIVDPTVLGTCSAATHDQWVVDGGDGFRYRTWHPQTDPTGCVYGHEHGDNPANIQHAEIASSPVRFGYIGRRHPMPGEPNGHEEAHEGFKVFIATPGEVNDEGRVNRVYSRSVFHMGTGGPKRFDMQMHSAEIRLVHPDFGLQGVHAGDDEHRRLGAGVRSASAGADQGRDRPGLLAGVRRQEARLAVEIWRTEGTVRAPNGREVYRPVRQRRRCSIRSRC